MKVFIACLGTIGDLNPYISVGTELSARGHQVTLLSDGSKRELIAKAGLGFGEVLSRGRWEHAMQRAYLSREAWVQELFQFLCLPAILPVFRYVLANHEPGNTLLIGVPGAIGLKFAQEKLGLPLVHLYLNPFSARRETTPKQNEGPSKSSPFDQLRRLIDLPALSVPIEDLLFAADKRIAAFPRWYGDADPDSVDLAYTDFIFSDEVSHPNDPQALDDFISQGSRPIVFTAGTAARHVKDFFAAAMHACERLCARAIFLSTTAEQLPPNLPDTILHSTYAPLNNLLPRVEGIVHHGGIGTVAQALRAGVIQLITPLAFDQFDNAERLAALGVGRAIADLRSIDLADQIRDLQSNADVKRRCAEVSQRLRGPDARSRIADLIETAM